jgi:aryl-alcohol dehydrogenase-like predicted oxidoreductase
MRSSRGAIVEQRPVGGSGLELSLVGLGGAWLGSHPADSSEVERAAAVMRAAYDCGVNWVDTSENYFDTGNETVIGAALRSVHDGLLICSKVAPGASHSGGGSGFRPDEIRRACEESLRRLRRDHLDLYLLHWPDDTGVPLEDSWGAMAALADQGHVRCIGLSNYEQDDIARCHAQRPVDVIQDGLSVIDHLGNRDLIRWCGERGIAVTIYEPLASGALTDTPFEQVRDRWSGGPWHDITVFPGLLCPENADWIRQVTDGLRAVGERLGATVAHVAVAWVLGQPGVSSAIVGSSSPQRVLSNARAADVRLDEDAMRVIDDLVARAPTSR